MNFPINNCGERTLSPRSLTLAIAAALCTASLSAHASGYRFGSQSVSAQGTAEANGAEAADASTVYANPAGLSRLDGSQIVGGVTAVVPHSTFTDTGSRRFTGASSGGQATLDSYTPGLVAAPSLYASKKLNDQWTAGFGLFVPYGTQLDYGNNWSGRYALTNVKLESIALNPSAGVKLNEQHSFGFGVSAQFMKAKLGQGVDVPGSIALWLARRPPSPCCVALSQPAATRPHWQQSGMVTVPWKARIGASDGMWVICSNSTRIRASACRIALQFLTS